MNKKYIKQEGEKKTQQRITLIMERDNEFKIPELRFNESWFTNYSLNGYSSEQKLTLINYELLF